MTFTTAKGATPISDLSGLKIAITTQSELDAAEFDNIHRAEQLYFRSKKFKNASWFTPSFLMQIHKEMFMEVWEWAGKYRKQSVMPIGLEPYKIPMMLYELSEDVAYWLKQVDCHLIAPVNNSSTHMTLLEMSARIHQRLAWIHPFLNGNGRFSRFISNLFLFSYRHPLPIWPGGLNKDSDNRQIYLEVLRRADHGDFQPLMDFLKFLGAVKTKSG